MKKLTIVFHILRKGLTWNKYPCPLRYSNPGSQQLSSLRSDALDGTATGIGIAELSCVFSWSCSQLSTTTILHLPLQMFAFHCRMFAFVRLKLRSDKGKSSYLPADNTVRTISCRTLDSGWIAIPQSVHPRVRILHYCPHNPRFRSIQHVTHFAIHWR